jgi:hypothetical protein
MCGDDPAPMYGARGKNTDDRSHIRGRWRQQSRTGAICRSPIPEPAVHQVDSRRNCYWSKKHQKKSEY